MAIADSPDGPWRKAPHPILEASETGVWRGEEDNRFLVTKKGDFDSHKVHGPCLMFYQGKFWLDYKGEVLGEEMTFGGREIAWGVAVAEKPDARYVKSPYNPVTNSGHEVAVWTYRGGMAALLITDGPEQNPIHYAPAGMFQTPDHDKSPLKGLRWGLYHALGNAR